jgi:putative flippase GtrA
MPRVATGEPLRYLCAVVLGLALDLGVALALRTLLGLPTVLAAAAGFCSGLGLNYLTFEYWVFGRGQPSWTGLGRLFLAAQTALILRLAAVWLLGLAGLPAPVVLVLATGLSFAANFFLSRLAVRRPG